MLLIGGSIALPLSEIHISNSDVESLEFSTSQCLGFVKRTEALYDPIVSTFDSTFTRKSFVSWYPITVHNCNPSEQLTHFNANGEKVDLGSMDSVCNQLIVLCICYGSLLLMCCLEILAFFVSLWAGILCIRFRGDAYAHKKLSSIEKQRYSLLFEGVLGIGSTTLFKEYVPSTTLNVFGGMLAILHENGIVPASSIISKDRYIRSQSARNILYVLSGACIVRAFIILLFRGSIGRRADLVDYEQRYYEGLERKRLQQKRLSLGVEPLKVPVDSLPFGLIARSQTFMQGEPLKFDEIRGARSLI